MLARLGLDHRASASSIKEAYRALVKRWHPDRFQEGRLKEEAGKKLAEINLAYGYVTRARRVRVRAPSGRATYPAWEPAFTTGFGGSWPFRDSAPQTRSEVMYRRVWIGMTWLMILFTARDGIRKLWESSPAPGRTEATFMMPRAAPEKLAVLSTVVIGDYVGMTFDRTTHQGASSLLMLRTHGSEVAGCLVVAPPLGGSGPINGRMQHGIISFESAAPRAGFRFMGLTRGDLLAGTLTRSDENGMIDAGQFKYERRPERLLPMAKTCPRDGNEAILTIMRAQRQATEVHVPAVSRSDRGVHED